MSAEQAATVTSVAASAASVEIFPAILPSTWSANGRAVFAVQCHVKDAGAELLHHLSLQLQAFAHPHFNAAVMVAHRQVSRGGLGAQKNFTRMFH